MAASTVEELNSLSLIIMLASVFIPAIIYLILLSLGVVKKPEKKNKDSDPFGDSGFAD